MLRVIALVLAVLVSGGIAADRGPDLDPVSGARLHGPVSIGGEGAAYGITLRKGRDALFGAVTITNAGDRTAELDAGRLHGLVRADQAELVALRVLDLGPAPGHGDVLGAGRWSREWRPMWRRARPIDRARLAPGHEAALVFRVRAHRTGVWRWTGSAIDYRVDGTSYTAVGGSGFALCPPRRLDRCW
ncbi:hypothetical protein [Pimelobacter simplex]|uniref:hypothetical protein n=1 Tax=Nocardioides simplex TaxID=2045 RepID=UPI003AAAA924